MEFYNHDQAAIASGLQFGMIRRLLAPRGNMGRYYIGLWSGAIGSGQLTVQDVRALHYIGLAVKDGKTHDVISAELRSGALSLDSWLPGFGASVEVSGNAIMPNVQALSSASLVAGDPALLVLQAVAGELGKVLAAELARAYGRCDFLAAELAAAQVRADLAEGRCRMLQAQVDGLLRLFSESASNERVIGELVSVARSRAQEPDHKHVRRIGKGTNHDHEHDEH